MLTDPSHGELESMRRCESTVRRRTGTLTTRTPCLGNMHRSVVGLGNMERRAQELGAPLAFRSGGDGTTVELRLTLA